MDAEHRGMPIYVLRANTVGQMEQFLSDLFNLSQEQVTSSDMNGVKEETKQAIAAVLNGERWVDLPPGHLSCADCNMKWRALPSW